MSKHVDAPLHVRGASEFVDDVPAPSGMLHAQVFASPVAHGTITDLELSGAFGVEGVVAVYTADDIPGHNVIGPIFQDEVLLAEGTVHYIGQPIALVVAETVPQARKAVRRIRADFDELPAIVNPREAYAHGSIIDVERTFQIGDVDAAWADCDVIVEGQCDQRGQEHLYLETNRSRAVPAEDGTVKVFASTQSPYAGQRAIARILGVAEHKVEIDVLRLGGGFGGKEDQATQWACMAAMAAVKLQRAVEIVLHRMDDIRMTGKRHPYMSDFKMGLKSDGSLVAVDIRHYQNAGAFADLSTAVLERTLFHSTNAYCVPNARIFAVCCRTNLPPNTAFRGFGGPQGMFVMESALAKASETLGMPREDVQRKNLLKEGDRFPYHQDAKHCRAIDTWEALDGQGGAAGMRDRVTEYNRVHRGSKMGLGVMPICFGISFTKTFLNQASALVLVYTDGSVSVANGGVEMGQGNSSKIRDIAAATFGIHENRVRSESTNTRRVANMSPSAASATSDLNGYATINACRKILDGLQGLAAKEFCADDPASVEIRGERVWVNGEKTEWDWCKLVQTAYVNRVSLCAHGFYATPGLHFDRESESGRPFAYHVYGAAAILVRLDCIRGTYDIESIRVVHDMGRPINRTVDLGQVEGGLAQGLGWMAMEDLQYTSSGRYTSNSLSTYKVPDVYFMPDDMEVTLLEDVENPHAPLGSKAVGEPPFMYGIGFFFAVRDAMRAFRPDADLPFDTPVTPERVLIQLYPDRVARLRAQFAAAPAETVSPA